MILAPRFLPRLASTLGLFTRCCLSDFARGQGLLELQAAAARHRGAAGLLIASSSLLPYWRTLGLAGIVIAASLASISLSRL